MLDRLASWARRTLLGFGLSAVRASGLRPSSRVVLVTTKDGRRLCCLNVRETSVEDGWLLVVDCYGKTDRYRLDDLTAVRHMRGLPELASVSPADFLRAAQVEGSC